MRRFKLKIGSIAIKGLLATIISFLAVVFITMFSNMYIKRQLFEYYATDTPSFVMKYNLVTSITLITSIIVFCLLFRRLTKRRLDYLTYIIDSVSKIENEKFLGKLEIKGNDEFADLARSINVMSKRLEENFKKEKEIDQL